MTSTEVTVALQGTLETFALPDVLRLLASTKKTGCYRLDGDRGSGSLWVKDGKLVGGTCTSSPNTQDPTEVAFELLRFADGEFVFDADATPEKATTAVDVEKALAAAEAMLVEWQEIEAVVPSLDAWVSLRPDLPGDDVTIRADRWICVVAIGGGATVGSLGEALGLGELPISREVKELVELGLIELGDAPAAAVSAPVSAPAPIPEPEPVPAVVEEYEEVGAVLEFSPVDDDEYVEARDEAPEEFVSFDANALVIEDVEPSFDESSSAAGSVSFEEDYEETYAPLEPAPAPIAAPVDANPTDAAEIARQLANLSPKAAKAVAAAAKATTQEEREAALAEVDDEEDPINRELLLKFLGSVNS